MFSSLFHLQTFAQWDNYMPHHRQSQQLNSDMARNGASLNRAEREVFLQFWNSLNYHQQNIVMHVENLQAHNFYLYSNCIPINQAQAVMNAIGANPDDRDLVVVLLSNCPFSYKTGVLSGFHKLSPRKYQLFDKVTNFCDNYRNNTGIALSPSNSQHVQIVTSGVGANAEEIYYIALSMKNISLLQYYEEKYGVRW